MKLKLFTFLLLSAAIITSCKKDKVFQDIAQYDAEQIQGYIKANGLTSMTTTEGDTSGIYYQILSPGNTAAPRIEYSDRLSIAFTIRSFDGKYTTTDTILNHFNGYLGQFTQQGLPRGLQLAIYNILQHKGGSMRLLIPSRLAYGKAGYGSGSSSNTSGRIAGNQCLDYYVSVVGDQAAYDDVSIQKYMTANSLSISEYTKHPSGFYYKITGQDTSNYIVKPTSYIKTDYSLKYLNNSVIQEQNDVTFNGASIENSQFIQGFDTGIKLIKPGQSISLLLPSDLSYGSSPSSSSGIIAFSCLRYEVTLKAASDTSL